MASIISAGNATNGLGISSDNTGILELKSGAGTGTTALSIGTNQVVTGTAGNVMLISGTAWSYTTGSPTEILFTGIPSWVKRITISFDGLSSTGAANYRVRLGTSAGIVTTGYAGNTTTLSETPSITTTTVSDALANMPTASAGVTIVGHVMITRLTGNTWVSSYNFSRTGDTRYGVGSGSVTLSADATQISILASVAIDAGSVNILYE